MNARAISMVVACLLAVSRVSTATPTWLPGPLSTSAGGANGPILASTMWDPDGAGPEPEWLVVGGAFTTIQGVNANRIAARSLSPASGRGFTWG